jgi:hypothetical protein
VRARVEGIEESPGKVNYLNGNQTGKWRTGRRTHAGVKFRNIYQGVDLVYYGNQRQLE